MAEWRKIPGYSTYEASSDGQLKTFNWKNQGKERIMKPAKDANGYLRTMLMNDEGRIVTVKVHRIIAMTFAPNPLRKPEVNHINGIRDDNSAGNLEWVTRSENMQHSFDFGKSSNLGERNPSASLTDDQVLEIRRNYTYGRKSRHDGGATKREIAEKYGTTYATIKGIVHCRSWKHLL